MTFENNHYEVVKSAISKEMAEYVSICFDILESVNLYYQPSTNEIPYPFGDDQTPTSFAWYASLHGESMVRFLKPKIEKITKKNLLEAYSYLRVYYKNSTLQKHIDRYSCEYSATLCIKKTENWPIFLEDLNKNIIEVELEPGDMLVYKGNLLPHWRESYLGNKHHQLFIHYIDATGPYCETNLYDGRQMLGLSSREKHNNVQ